MTVFFVLFEVITGGNIYEKVYGMDMCTDADSEPDELRQITVAGGTGGLGSKGNQGVT